MSNESGKKTIEVGKGKAINRTYSMYPRDVELSKWGAKYLGCSDSEFVRSAIRMFATHLQAINKRGEL